MTLLLSHICLFEISYRILAPQSIAIYANPVIFWVPVAGVRWKWSSDLCLITETKKLENTVRCLYISHHKVFTVKDESTYK